MPEPLSLPIAQAVQDFTPGDLVELFDLDLTDLGDTILRFSPGNLGEKNLSLAGVKYTPFPIQAEGFEWSGTGAFPTPKLRVSNTTTIMKSLVIDFQEMVGAKLIRRRTFRQFLDDGENPNPGAMMPLDIYFLERMSLYNKELVEWELSSSIDQQGKMLPGRQVLRDACTHRYRNYNAETASFNYTGVTCPYAGTDMFDENGNMVTDPLLDRCSKLVRSGCRKRFGENGVLPTWAFPGVSRT